MLILPITRSWMCSRRARRVYTVCAVLALILQGTLMGISAAQAAAGARTLPPAGEILLDVVWIPGVLGSALLWVAMLYFWFGFDTSHWAARAVWLPVIYILALFGPALYCFLVYRRLAGQEPVAPAQGA